MSAATDRWRKVSMRDAPYTSDLRARGNTLAAILDRLERVAEDYAQETGTFGASWAEVLRIIREGS